MGERSVGISEVRAFVEPYLGPVSWVTLRRTRKRDRLPIRYQRKGRRLQPYLDHEEFFAWLEEVTLPTVNFLPPSSTDGVPDGTPSRVLPGSGR